MLIHCADYWVHYSYGLRSGIDLRAAGAAVTGNLLSGTSAHVPLHRDLYDKQIFYSHAGIGILDFDTIAQGEAALDLANMLVHFELRALQGLCSPRQAADATAAILAGYAPEAAVQQRLSAYADATRLRLACVYLFRSRWHQQALQIAGRIGQTICK